ncbi:MAG: hypothetical protein U5L96_21335 [Owenweeksia sp.]|nr:hypothetical protein [Owenweeksia sp.]
MRSSFINAWAGRPRVAESHAIAASLALSNGNLALAQREITEALLRSRQHDYPYQYARHLLIKSRVLQKLQLADEALVILLKADSLTKDARPLAYLKREY